MSQKQTCIPSCTAFLQFTHLCFQNTYGAAIGTLEQVSKVVDSLYAKVRSCIACTVVCAYECIIQTIKIA
jgi:Na+-translocating ferredoxin:NAD+ oxidoreductase RnfC subunit